MPCDHLEWVPFLMHGVKLSSVGQSSASTCDQSRFLQYTISAKMLRLRRARVATWLESSFEAIFIVRGSNVSVEVSAGHCSRLKSSRVIGNAISVYFPDILHKRSLDPLSHGLTSNLDSFVVFFRSMWSYRCYAPTWASSAGLYGLEVTSEDFSLGYRRALRQSWLVPRRESKTKPLNRRC